MTGTDTDRTRRLFVALVATTVAVLVTGTIVGAIAPGAAVGGAETEPGAHANPATVEGSSDLSAAERQMADRLAQRVRSGSINISREQAQQARESLSDSEYEALLDRYAEVANETGQTERAIAFRRVRSDQIALADAVEAYWRAYEWYRLLENGSVTRQQRIRMAISQNGLPYGSLATAHRLERHWQRIDERHAELVASQRQLAELSEGNVTASLAEINASVQRINATHQQVRDEQFTETNLTVTTDDEQASFRDPLVIDGRLTTVDGEAIGNRQVRFEVGNQTLRTRTDSDGQFTLRYRPTTISANATNVTVRYRPDNRSIHLPSERTVDIDIEQVEPSVTVNAEPETIAYNETLRVSGRVGEAGVANVSYLVFVDGQVLARNETDADGQFVSNVSIPAEVDDGVQPVRVFVPLDGQAVHSPNETTSVDVTERQTDLRGSVDHVKDRTLRVSGSFQTAGSTPITGQQITVVANGAPIGSVTTGTGGEYDGTFVVPDDVVTAGPFDTRTSIGIVLRYDGSTTNLADAATEKAVSLPTTPIGTWAVGGLAVLLVAIGIVAVWRRFEGRRTDAEPVADQTQVEQALLNQVDREREASASDLLERAYDHATAGRNEAAIRTAYVALRSRLASDITTATALTPWEFYQICAESAVDEDVLRVLRRVTELYEIAQFTDEQQTDKAVTSTLDRVNDLLDAGSPSDRTVD